jgi:hypothetical protein
MDYYFGAAYNMVVSDTSSSMFVFKKFSKAALREDSDTKKASHVSNCWKEVFNQLINQYQGYREYGNLADEEGEVWTINLQLGAHSGKKRALNEMANSSLQPLAIIFRGGWEMRNVHTLFDYIYQKEKHDINAAKVCAGWKFRYADSYYGGYPVDIEDITDGKDKFGAFVGRLFYGFPSVPNDVKRLYGCSVLRFYEDFIATLAREPTGMYNVLNKHPFVSRIQQALRECDVPVGLFKNWQVDIKQAFMSKNLAALSMSDCHNLGGAPDFHGVLMDPRCFLEAFNDLANFTRGLGTNQMTILNKVNRGLMQMSEIKAQNDKILQMNDKILQMLEGKRETKSRGLHGVSNDVEEEHVMDYEALMKLHDHNLSPLKLFELWFEEKMPASYSNLLPKSASARNKFTRQKTCMGVLLKFTNTYPLSKPSQPHLLVGWKHELNKIGVEALELVHDKLSVELGKAKKARIANQTITNTDLLKLKKNPIVASRSWPVSMPSEAKLWFEC